MIFTTYITIPDCVANTATVALQTKFAGLENEQMLQAILRHVVESATFMATSALIAEPLAENTKSETKVAASSANKQEVKTKTLQARAQNVVDSDNTPPPKNNANAQKLTGAMQTVPTTEGNFNDGPAILDISNVNPNNVAPKNQAIVVRVGDNNVPERSFLQEHKANNLPRIKSSSILEKTMDFVISPAYAEERPTSAVNNSFNRQDSRSIVLQPMVWNTDGATLSLYDMNARYYPRDSFAQGNRVAYNQQVRAQYPGAYQNWFDNMHGLNDSMQNSGFVSLASSDLLPIYGSQINPIYRKTTYTFPSSLNLVTSNGNQTLSASPIIGVRHANALPFSNESPWHERKYNIIEKALIWYGGALHHKAAHGK